MLGGEVIQQRLFMINGNEIHGWSRQGSGLTEQGHRGCDVEEANLVPLWRNAAHAGALRLPDWEGKRVIHGR